MRLIDLTGTAFGRLTVVSREETHNRRVMWLCACICGSRVIVPAKHLRSGATVSCGCYTSERAAELGRASATHNMHRTPEYHSWRAMRDRCLNPNVSNFPAYGGAGVTICPEWDSFQQFYDDMGTRPAGTSLDRIDPWGNYEPGNCRWADAHTQRMNQRHLVHSGVTT